jgi:hypothetical protein
MALGRGVQEFKEFKEFKERSEDPGARRTHRGRNGWRGAALGRA